MDERYIIDNSGKKMAVVLAIGDYERMMEDLHDLALVAEQRRDEPSVSIEEIKRKLKADGLIQN